MAEKSSDPPKISLREWTQNPNFPTRLVLTRFNFVLFNWDHQTVISFFAWGSLSSSSSSFFSRILLFFLFFSIIISSTGVFITNLFNFLLCSLSLAESTCLKVWILFFPSTFSSLRRHSREWNYSILLYQIADLKLFRDCEAIINLLFNCLIYINSSCCFCISLINKALWCN